MPGSRAGSAWVASAGEESHATPLRNGERGEAGLRRDQPEERPAWADGQQMRGKSGRPRFRRITADSGSARTQPLSQPGKMLPLPRVHYGVLTTQQKSTRRESRERLVARGHESLPWLRQADIV